MVVSVMEETRVIMLRESVSFSLSKSLSFGINQSAFVSKVRVKCKEHVVQCPQTYFASNCSNISL